jgi:sulfide:quinone oxidoreductase
MPARLVGMIRGMSTPASPLHVLVAGGGVAGLEALMALRDLAGNRVRLTLLTPEEEFVYRPMAVAAPFARGRARRIALDEVLEPLSVQRRRTTLEEVDLERRAVYTSREEWLDYDALVVATGGRSVPGLPSATTWTPEADASVFGGILRDLEDGYLKRLAFVVPRRVAWPLPAYELALMTAWDARDVGRGDLQIAVHTHEATPLSVFGPAAGEALRRDLEEAGVSVRTGVDVADARELGADRVVSLPMAAPNTPRGLPTDDDGFLPVDRHGQVQGSEDVWAAGDVIAFPVKQGGLAAQQADAVAEAIAARAGADVEPAPFRAVLRGVVLTGRGKEWVRRDLDEDDPEGEAARHALWWPPTKVAGRYLSGYLTQQAETGEAPEREPDGQPVELDLDRDLPAA